jgi:hypothetical protein
MRKGVPSLRTQCLVREVRRTRGLACERGGFRVAHYSIPREQDLLGQSIWHAVRAVERSAGLVFEPSGPIHLEAPDPLVSRLAADPVALTELGHRVQA